ncbi:hypothetical protein ACLGI4_25395 [Streptomyces sp. HMX112]|uniref:hypothetical protein n=1 Tax=Streptomyces sp. HMX112 TaxID=3390850 RepID=UPI003A7F6DB4
MFRYAFLAAPSAVADAPKAAVGVLAVTGALAVPGGFAPVSTEALAPAPIGGARS